VVFLLAEAVRGKPVPLAWRIRLLNVGFWLLVGVMLLALGNDVLRFFR
jgi:membrane-associated protease RseP (regulator of RpoE activity)